MIDEVDRLISYGKLDEALSLIDRFNQHQRLKGIILTSRIKEIQGRFADAHDLAAEALAISLNEGRKMEELGARIALAYALLRQNRLEEAGRSLDEARKLLDGFPQNQYQQIKRYEATIYNIEGLIYRTMGELPLALEKYKHSLEIRGKLGIEHEKAASKTNIGTVYRLKGELELAEKYHVEAKESFEKLDNQNHQAYALHSLGEIYWEQGDLKLALKHYEEALSIRLQLPNNQNTCSTLYDLVRLNLEFDYAEHAKFYFDMLQELAKNVENQLVKDYSRMAEALMLQTSSRIVQRAESQKIMESLLHENLPVDFKTDIYLNLCNLYITELRISKNEEIITKVEELIARLHMMSKQQKSSLLRIETLLIRAKLFLINLDLETAQQVLFQAELMANSSGLHNLAYRISAEHDNLINKLYQWDEMKRRNASLIERMEEANFGDLLNDLRLRRNHNMIPRELEEPLFLLVMNRDAVPLYTSKFSSDIDINQDLIGSFLMASDMGMAVALDETGSIERIKYGDYTLIFIHHDRLVFCYGYEGQSYYAIRRLQDFIERIRLSRVWDLLRSNIPRPKLIEQDLQNKVADYFSPEGVYSKQHNLD